MKKIFDVILPHIKGYPHDRYFSMQFKNAKLCHCQRKQHCGSVGSHQITDVKQYGDRTHTVKHVFTHMDLRSGYGLDMGRKLLCF